MHKINRLIFVIERERDDVNRTIQTEPLHINTIQVKFSLRSINLSRNFRRMQIILFRIFLFFIFCYPCTVYSYIRKVHTPTNALCINPLTPNDHYSGRTAPLTSKISFHIFIQ